MPFEHYHSFDWTTNDHWLMPDGETMYTNQMKILKESVEDVVLCVPPTRRSVCIQAGGAMGLWPIYYSLCFDYVITFEPLPANWECLQENLHRSGRENVTPFPFALSSDSTIRMSAQYSKEVLNSYGAHWMKPEEDGDVLSVSLDNSFFWDQVDLIHLDIEGGELDALRGAEKIISEFRPVIALEVRNLPHFKERGIDPSDAQKWLATKFGYRVVGRSADDVVMA